MLFSPKRKHVEVPVAFSFVLSDVIIHSFCGSASSKNRAKPVVILWTS